MGKKFQKVPHFVDQLVNIGIRNILQVIPNVGEQTAKKMMLLIASELCRLYARTEMYIPANFGLDDRNTAIREAYETDGPNGVKRFTCARIEQIAHAHQMTTRNVRKILE